MTRWDLATFVAESRAKQSLPPTVEDPHALTDLARLLLAATTSPTDARSG